MEKVKQYLKQEWARLAFVFVALLGMAFIDPSLALASAMLTTSTAQLANGTIIQISVGSPTGFVTIGNARNITFLDGSAAEVDVTNLTSDWRERLLGLPDGGIVSFEVDTDFGNVGQAACITAKNNRTRCDFKVILPGGTTPNVTFAGYVRKFNANAAVDSAVKSNVEFLVTGPVVLA